MKGKLLLLLAALLLIGALSGCAQNADDVLGMVGETPIYRWYYDAHLVNQLELYEKYYGADLTDPAYRTEYEEYRVQRLEDLVGEAAIKEEARKQGFFELSAEQEAEVDAQYIAYYERNLNALMEQYGSDEAGRREAEKAYENMLSESSLTPERVRTMLRDQYVINLFTESVGRSVNITDAEIEAEYERLLEEQKAGIEEDPNWLGDNVPGVIVYVPEGYVRVIRIRQDFTEAQYKELTEAANNVDTAMTEYMAALMSDGEDAVTTGIKQSAFERVSAIYDGVFTRIAEEAVASMEQFAEPIDSPEAFHKALTETADRSIVNYYVNETSTHVEEAFRDAAMALQNVGDISAPVVLENGACIILLEEKLEPGVRSLEETRDAIRASLAATASISENFNMRNEYAEAAEEAGIVELHPDKL